MSVRQRDIGQADARVYVPAGRERRGCRKCHDMSCSVMFLVCPLALCAACGGRSRGASYPSVRRSAARLRKSESVPVSRVSRARLRAGAGGRFAPARFTRVIARARRRAHLPRRLATGSFSRPPAIAFLRRKAERQPRKPPLSIVIIHPICPESSPLRGLNSKHVLPWAQGTRFRAGQVDAALGFFSASGSNPITQNSGICARISHPWPERFREKSFSIFRTG